MSEMLDDILSLENISLAVAKVCSNRGAGGVDGYKLAPADCPTL